MQTPAVITKEWVSQTFSHGSIVFNPFYKSFLVTFETERYHNGSMTGGTLAQQLERDGEIMKACSSFDILRFATVDEATEFCHECGVTPYVGHVIYHVNGTYRIVQ
jgi:hypothetical protein